MTIFGKLAYDAGVGVLTLLSLRFIAGSVGLAALAGLRRRVDRQAAPAAAPGRAFLLGALVYALQSAALFTALTTIDASLAVLLLYTYPAFVVAGAALLRRETVGTRTLVVLLMATAGIGLVLGAGHAGSAVGVALGVAAGAGWAVYVLTADALLEHADPVALSALVCAGAASTFTAVAIASGSLEWPGGEALVWVAGITIVSTVAATACLFAGIQRVGPSRASLLSTTEPVFAIGLAFAVFGETLSATQLAGAALVVGAVAAISIQPRTQGAKSCRTAG
jgi:drug/metabolite transporter (DMT)-like permease